MTDRPDGAVVGHAALSICESLLVAMRELGVLSEKDISGLLEDAAAVHRGASEHSDRSEFHQQVAALIDRISAGKNALPRS